MIESPYLHPSTPTYFEITCAESGSTMHDPSAFLGNGNQVSFEGGQGKKEPVNANNVSVAIAAISATVEFLYSTILAVPVSIAEHILAFERRCNEEEERDGIDLENEDSEKGQMKRVTSRVVLGDTYGVSTRFSDDALSPPSPHTIPAQCEGQELIFSPLRATFGSAVVQLAPESSTVLEASPRILSHSMMQALAEHGLPLIMSVQCWKRIYSLSRDGDAFEVMLEKVKDHSHTLFAVRTTNDEILGGFVGEKWESPGSEYCSAAFYGSGQSFLFSANNAKSHASKYSAVPSTEGEVNIYKWSGINHYIQLCDPFHTRLAMGGEGFGGNFGLCIEDCFRRGTTGSCDTFRNKPLATSERFDILDFEVYGFTDCI